MAYTCDNHITQTLHTVLHCLDPSTDEPNRKKFHLKGPLMVATYYGKRTDNDYLREEGKLLRKIRLTDTKNGAFKLCTASCFLYSE